MTTSDTAVHTQPFQAEVSELLHLMVHSVYSETDIFLRELVSNASDACDKLRYEAIANPALLGEGDALKIRIIPNKTAGTLAIADNGIGMERQELIDHLGTIARSGTKAFVSKLKEAKDGLGLIGQFGVGFYSAFMVADKIVVVSRRAGESDVWTWTSSGGSGLAIGRARGEEGGRVFITDDADLLPGYLRFIRGVVDSEDLPLNISREMLQNNPQLAQIRKAVATRVLSELESLAEKDPENFAKIWEAFGAVLKEGIYEDFERREKLLALSRFTTTTGEKRSLKEIIADFKPNQTEIYYLVGDSIERLKSNPRLEAASARGIEVLLLSDPVDAFWTSMPTDFDGKPLKSLSQGDLNLDLIPRVHDTDEAKKDEPAADEAATIAVIKAALGERVSDVKASTRLTSSASCLVADSQGPSRELERILAQQNRGLRTKPVLEINLRHPMVGAITKAQAGSKVVDDLSLLLLEQAQILDGELPEDPAAFAARLNRLVLQGLGG